MAEPTKKEKILYFIEKNGPGILGLVGGGVILWIATKHGLGNNFNKILDATNVFSSIIVGFVGALLGILYSIRNTELLNNLFKYREKRNLLKSYFTKCISAGIILVACTLMLYLRTYLCLTALVLFVFSWGFLLVYTFLCTYRIINIMIHIIFMEDKDKEEPSKTESVTMDGHDKDKLKERLNR